VTNLPDWNDDEGLLALVDAHWIDQRQHRPDNWRELYHHHLELEAIDAAKAGNFRPLALLRKGMHKLSVEAEDLITWRLLGLPREKEGRGSDQRSKREKSPTFRAAQSVPVIMDILQQHFTGRRPYKVRAQELAAKQWGVQVDTLINFMAKGRHI
jgi:hypothetical protein